LLKATRCVAAAAESPTNGRLDLTQRTLTDEELLSEFEDLLRTIPPRPTLRHKTDENFAWFGRAKALIAFWDLRSSPKFDAAADTFLSDRVAYVADEAFPVVMSTIHQARNTLRMRTIGPIAAAFEKGRPYDYFEEVRKIILTAQKDLLFIDRYMEADFVSAYCTLVKAGVTIRLLTSHALSALLPAVNLLAQQSGASIEVRESQSNPKPHDRLLFVDGSTCYISSASFKDGARTSPAIFMQMVDVFDVLHRTYEAEWQSASVKRAP
jgi:hypothetical protein